jgi:hypothetical protein
MLEEHKRGLASPPQLRRSSEEEEYEALLSQYAWLGWWRRDTILNALKRYKQALLDVLHRFNKPEISHFDAAFIGRFELDFRRVVDVYRGTDSYCISFCVKDLGPAHCYERGRGRHDAQRPRFLRLKPLPDGRLVEIRTVEGKELVKVA